jgi:hypothetical protein
MEEKQGGVHPRGESLRHAMKWMSERRQHDAHAPRMKIIEEAALRFDLTPLDVDFLAAAWKEE